VHTCEHCGRTGPSSALPVGPVRNGPDDAQALSRLESGWITVDCVGSRQAYQALKSLATHKTDRNDARGLAHLARTGFFKPVHVKSLPAHAVCSLITAGKP
jgi:hypothetical protein